MADPDRSFHEARGARFSPFEGREMPESYGDPEAEYRALCEGAGVLDRSSRARIEVSGTDRTSFLHGLLSNDVARLREGEGMYALLLTPRGMLVSDLLLYHLGDRFLLDVPPERGEAVAGKLDMFVLSSDVTVSPGGGDRGLLTLAGPGAGRLLEAVGLSPPGERYGCARGDVGGRPVVLGRHDHLGVDGFDLHLPAGATGEVFAALCDAGAVPVGWRAAETVRILRGVPRYGAELREGLLPPEVGFLVERAISYTKGCYLGQETIARVKTHGRVNRELRRLVFQGGRILGPGALLTREGAKAGVVTSACLPPDRDRAVGLGFVSRKLLEAGMELDAEVPGGTVRATVAE